MYCVEILKSSEIMRRVRLIPAKNGDFAVWAFGGGSGGPSVHDFFGEIQPLSKQHTGAGGLYNMTQCSKCSTIWPSVQNVLIDSGQTVD